MQNYEQLLLQRLFQGDTSWAQAVYIAGMFAILIWRRERVVNWWLLRTSYLLYGAALVLPHVLTPLVQLLVQNHSGDAQIFTYIVATAIGPTFLAGAVICGLGSMIPRLIIAQPPGPPPKHPLD
jgi:hypothetical protein